MSKLNRGDIVVVAKDGVGDRGAKKGRYKLVGLSRKWKVSAKGSKYTTALLVPVDVDLDSLAESGDPRIVFATFPYAFKLPKKDSKAKAPTPAKTVKVAPKASPSIDAKLDKMLALLGDLNDRVTSLEHEASVAS